VYRNLIRNIENENSCLSRRNIRNGDIDKLNLAKVKDLNDPGTWNRWIIGTPDDVPETSPFYSRQIQIAYVNNPEKGLLEKGTRHFHKPPIEEYYLVLEGSLEIEVESEIFSVEPMQILKVPPMKRHKITGYSLPLRFFTIRTPISSTETRISRARSG
jgi:mannose-6-phosphate isomerase-like protein (cupin superfamily)